MRTAKKSNAWPWCALMVLVVLSACTTTPGAGDAGRDAQPPAPADAAGARCVLSADCPSGTHCDLGECVQDCNLRDPCTGQRTCTPRGRCVTAGVAEQDPPATPPTGQLAVSPPSVGLAVGDTMFAVQVTAPGRTRYRIEIGAPWLHVTAPRGEFTDHLALSVQVDASAVPRDGSVATVRVVTTQGHGELQVVAPTSLAGVYRGSVTYDRVRVRSAGGTADVPLHLGTARLGIQLREERGVVQVRIDPEASLLWPASAGAPAQGTGTVANGQVDVRIAQRLGPRDLPALLGAASPNVFGEREIGRQLHLQLTVGEFGALVGTAVESVHGLTGSAVELVGVVQFNPVAGARLDDFTVGIPPDMPAPAVRQPGPMPLAGCAPTASGTCSLAATRDEQRACVVGRLRAGFRLHLFADGEDFGAFRLDPTVPMDPAPQTPYAIAATDCATDLGTDWRLDAPPAASDRSCVYAAGLQCARFLTAGLFAETDPYRMQGAHDVARAWGELFALLGNEAMVAAYRAPYMSTTPAAAMRVRYVDARRAYDAGLARLLDPRLFEELRAVSPALAAEGPGAPASRNDRVALRRLADLLGGTLRATTEIVRLDTGTPEGLPALRAQVTRDAALLWLQTALVADLDARWRGAQGPVAEVLQLGAVLSGLDRAVAALDPEVNPLGIPRAYVPLLARTNASDVQTNFERIFAAAGASVAAVTASDAAALAATRQYDQAGDQIAGELMASQTLYAGQLRELCGNDFVRSDNTADPDWSHCGAATGQYRDVVQAGEAARLQLFAAMERIHDATTRAEIQAGVITRTQSLRAAEVAFVDSTGQELDAFEWAGVGLDAINRAIGVASNSQLWNLGTPAVSAIGAAAVELARGAINIQRQQLQRMQQMQALRTAASETYVRDMARLKELLLDVQGLKIEASLRALDLARALDQAATARERLGRLVADWERARAWATRRFLNDPAFRIERDRGVVAARTTLEQGRVDLYLAVRALEYETNTELTALAQAVFAAQNGVQLEGAQRCVRRAWDQWRMVISSPNDYVTELSLRRDVFGIQGPRTDPETGQTVSAGEQFRQVLFAQPLTRDGHLWPAARFATTLRPDHGLFSALVCNDRVATLEAQLVGDFLGDNQAEVQVLADGGTLLRACDAPAGAERIVPWNLRPRGQPAPAAVQAGVNSYGTAAPNLSLLGFGVAQTSWVVAVPDGQSAPANRDVDPLHIDDIVLRIRHTAIAGGGGSAVFRPTCE